MLCKLFRPDRMLQNSVVDAFCGFGSRSKLFGQHCFGLSSRSGTFCNKKVSIYFLFLHEKVSFGYSLEVSHQGSSNEYQ